MGPGLQSLPMGSTASARVLIVVFSGLFGLMIGSFLNVVVYRVPRGMSVVTPPSHCPNCQRELAALDNVPLLSWLALRGRCRFCGTPISPRYPVVELATGLVFLCLAWSLGTADPLLSLLVVAGASIAATAIDLDGLAVPWSVAIAAAVGAGSLALVAPLTGQPGRLGWAAVGGVAAALAAGGMDVVLSGHGDAHETGPGDAGRAHWARRAALAASLGWCAGWLWAPGALILAGWVVTSGLAIRLIVRTPPVRSLALLLIGLGAFGVVIAGALLNT